MYEMKKKINEYINEKKINKKIKEKKEVAINDCKLVGFAIVGIIGTNFETWTTVHYMNLLSNCNFIVFDIYTEVI